MRTFLSCVGVAIASVTLTVVVFLVYATIQDSAGGKGKMRVPFSDFLAEVESGRVDEIHVDGRVYTYKVHGFDGKTATRETVGPKADMAALKTLRPIDPNLPPPTIDAP